MIKLFERIRRLGITTRLIVYYAAFAIITVATVAYFAYNQAAKSLHSSVEDKLTTVAQLKQDFLIQWVDEQQRNAIFLANLPEMESLSGVLLNQNSTSFDRNHAKDELTSLLKVISQQNGDFRDVQILDQAGKIVVSASGIAAGLSQANQPYFIEGQSKTFTQSFYNSDLFNKITLTVATPLVDSKDKRVGVLALHFNMKEVDNILYQDQNPNQKIRSYLVSPQHQMITEDSVLSNQYSEVSSFAIDSAIAGGNGLTAYHNPDGIPVIGRYLWLENLRAVLIVEIDEHTALLPARQLSINIMAFGSIVSVLLILIVILIARQITAPLRTLTETATRISGGDLEVSVPVLSKDEVGILAQTFNSMTEELRQTLAGLQTELHERRQVEDELVELRKVMDESGDAIYLIDPEDTHYINFNESAYKWLGYTREELLQLNVTNVAQTIPNLEVWQERYDHLLEKGELIFETVYRRKDGSLFPVEVSARVLDYRYGRVVLAMARDIGERKQAENALRESEGRFRKIFQSSPVAICITRFDDGRLLDANYAYWELSGFDPATSKGHDPFELDIWSNTEERSKFTKKLKQKHSLYNADYSFKDIHGNRRSTLAFYELMQLGGEECILSMFYDMSAQKETMQALQQSETRVRALLEAIPDMIIELSLDGLIINMIPPKGLEAFMPPEEFVGRQVYEVFTEETASQTLFAIERAIASNQMNIFEFEARMGGTIHIMEARIVASASNTALMMLRDITQRKWIENEREQLINELEHKNIESETLRESLVSIVTTFDLKEVLERILDQIKLVIPYDSASIWRVEDEWQTLLIGHDLPPNLSTEDQHFLIDADNASRPLLLGEVSYVLSNNVQEEFDDFKGVHSYINSWLAVPMKKRNKITGLIALDGKNRGQFTEHHAELAVTFANQMAIALENTELFESLQAELNTRAELIRELEDKNAETETLRESAAIVAASLDTPETIRQILEQIKRVVEYDSASIWLYQDDKAIMVGSNSLPPGAEQPGFYIVSAEEPDYGFMSDNVPFILFEDIQDQYHMFREPPINYIHGWLAVPLHAREKLTGFISLDSTLPGKFTERDANLAITFADQVSIALENARLFSDLQAELRKQIAMRSAAMSISSSLDMDQVLGEICKQMCVILDGTSAYISQYDKNHSAYMVVADYMGATASSGEQISDTEITYYREDGARIFDETEDMENFEVVHLEDENISDWLKNIMLQYGGRTILYMPLYVQGQLIGHAELWDSRTSREFTKDEISFCRAISQQAAIALANANLYKQLQDELEQRKSLISELESKNAELEQFTYTVSHDLKSPLFTIRGFLGYLEQDALSGQQERIRADVQRIAGAAEKMNQLLNELLELSRVGRLRNDPVRIPFDELAREAVDLVEGRIMERGITVHIESDMPVIFGDRSRLLEVMQNLVDNAAKFMDDQTNPRIDIGQTGEEAGMPVFYIRDNGVGIALEHHERVFGLFNKLDVKADGTGIGLALVKRIIEFHGGRIWIESEAGKGSTFKFTLPAADATTKTVR